MKSKFELSDVFKIIDSKDETKIYFSAFSRSVMPVMEVFQIENKAITQEQAKEYILEGIRTLTPEHFVRTVILFNDSTYLADEYGCYFDNKPWYIKFRIDEEGNLEEVSFHPPLRDIVTSAGIVIEARRFL